MGRPKPVTPPGGGTSKPKSTTKVKRQKIKLDYG